MTDPMLTPADAMISPSESAYLRGAPQPLVLTTEAVHDSPYALYRRLTHPTAPSFLLESGVPGSRVGRYSFLGSQPYLVFSGKGDHYEWSRPETGTIRAIGDPWAVLVDLLRKSHVQRPANLPPFIGGTVGVVSYDLAPRFERLHLAGKDDLGFPDLHFLFHDVIVAIDHERALSQIIFMPPLERFEAEPREKLYREGCDRLLACHARLLAHNSSFAAFPSSPLHISVGQSPEEYESLVRHCQRFIEAGDIYQANLSHRFTVQWPGDNRSVHQRAVDLYGRLRAVNPSPFSALLQLGPFSLVSGSPERLVRLVGKRADTRPIAGTRPRGGTADDDRRLGEELLANVKERAEHVMLVDLERNDLGRVCRYGSVRVDEFMALERYSHVSHIVSNVTGQLRDGVDGFDLLAAMFPGGTITGVPKIRCMEIIDALEPVRRGPYTGSIGYFSWSGDLDFNILIRTLLLTKDRGYLQVGAGIVADSDPKREYEETLFKAAAAIQALGPPCGSS